MGTVVDGYIARHGTHSSTDPHPPATPRPFSFLQIRFGRN